MAGEDLISFFQENKLRTAIGLIGFFLLALGIFSASIFSSKKQKAASIEILSSESVKEADIYVHVAGAVEKPGLFKLSANARVNDALIVAGGLAPEADRVWFNKSLNLAQKLSDGAKLYIPAADERVNSQSFVAGAKTTAFNQGEVFNKDKININTASQAELERLVGIGPSYAQKIIDYRQSHGNFAKIEDIMKVPGIGEKTFEKIKNEIRVI